MQGGITIDKTTFFHLAAFELFNAVKVIAVAFAKAGHIIALLFAFTPTNIIERKVNIFIVAVLINVGVILRTAALSLVNGPYQCRWSPVQFQAVQVVASWTQRPDIATEKQ